MQVDQTTQQRLEDTYGSGSSSLSGSDRDPLEGRIAHLDHHAQEAIREMSRIQHDYPIRAYETADRLRAGIICPPFIKEQCPAVYRRFAELFRLYHDVVCEVFHAELVRVAEDAGIVSEPQEERFYECQEIEEEREQCAAGAAAQDAEKDSCQEMGHPAGESAGCGRQGNGNAGGGGCQDRPEAAAHVQGLFRENDGQGRVQTDR